MPPDNRHNETMSVEDFLVNLGALTETDKNRLMLFASKRCWACRFEAEDLLNEAIARTIEGIRNCPHYVNIMTFLFETMRSIVSSEMKSIEKHGESSLTLDDQGASSHQIDIYDEALSPEQQVISDLEAKTIKDEIFSLFQDDEIAQFIIECWTEEMTPDEIRDATGLDNTKYNSKLKKIRRRFNASYPRGFTNE